MNYDLFVKNEKKGASSLRCAKRGREGGGSEAEDPEGTKGLLDIIHV